MSLFASTPAINTDPDPWYNPDRERGYQRSPYSLDDHSSRFSPRREYDKPRAHEANPVLLVFREDHRKFQTPNMARVYLDQFDSVAWSGYSNPEALEHARKVLTRYVAVFS